MRIFGITIFVILVGATLLLGPAKVTGIHDFAAIAGYACALIFGVGFFMWAEVKDAMMQS